MSKRILVLDAFDKKPVSRVPVGFWFHFVAEDKLYDGLTDKSIDEISLNGHKEFYNNFQPDFIKIMSDGWFEYPNPKVKKINSSVDLHGLKPVGSDHEWIQRQVEHVGRLTKIFGQDIVSFYNIFSPSKYLRLLYGSDGDALLARLIAEDKQAVRHALAVIAEDLGYLAEGVIQQGHTDGIYFCAQSIQDSSVNPELYQEIVEPSDRHVLEQANRVSDYNILHICGYQGSRNDLSRFTHYEAKAVNWAVHIEGTDLASGRELFGGRAVIGGLDNRPTGLLNTGSRQDIEQAVTELLSVAGTTGTIIGADCSLPADIDLRRLEWVRQQAASLSKIRR
jgi:uroporphyrinogen decarboxylase